MLSTPPITKTLVNKTHAARRIAARIASAFVPAGNLAPLSHEALCYGCMAGIVMPIHHDIAPCGRNHDDRKLRLNPDRDDASVATPDQVQKAVGCHNVDATGLSVQMREADGKGSRRMFMFNEALDRLRTAVPEMVLQIWF